MEVDVAQYDASGILECDALVPSIVQKAAKHCVLYQRQDCKSDENLHNNAARHVVKKLVLSMCSRMCLKFCRGRKQEKRERKKGYGGYLVVLLEGVRSHRSPMSVTSDTPELQLPALLHNITSLEHGRITLNSCSLEGYEINHIQTRENSRINLYQFPTVDNECLIFKNLIYKLFYSFGYKILRLKT